MRYYYNNKSYTDSKETYGYACYIEPGREFAVL